MNRLKPRGRRTLKTLLVGIGAGLGSPFVLALEANLSWSRGDPESWPVEMLMPSPAAPIKDIPPKKPASPAAPVHTLDALIETVAAEQALDTRLLHAMIYVESRYNAQALSNKGAVGLMQVMPATGERFGFSDLRHPKTNLRAGATYMKWLLAHFDHDLELALAAYNAGEGAVKKYGRTIPPYPETQHYVQQVVQRYREDSRTASPARPSSRSVSPRNSADAPKALPMVSRMFELLLSTPGPVTHEH